MNRHVNRRAFTLGAVAAGAALAAGRVGRARAQTPPLKVGVLLPRSGYLAGLGQICQKAVDIAVPLLRERGYALETMNADFESKPDIARTQAERLIREGANILMGAFESGATMVIAQVCEQHGIPFVVNIAADPQITEQGFKFTFRNFPTSPMLGSSGLRLFNDLFKATGTTPRTAVLMHANDTFGQSMAKGVKALAPKIGLPFEIVETISYDPQAKDLSIEVAKAKAAKADLQMVITRLNDAILMVREMVKQRYAPMGIITPGSPGMYERPFFKALGKYAEYCISNVPWFDPKQEMTPALERAFTKAYPEESFDLNTGFSFEAMLIAADAWKRAGSTRPEALVEALRATDIAHRVMVGGPIRFDAKGQNVETASAAVQNRNGRPTVVLPAANAELAPVFPMPDWSRRG